MSLYYCKLWIIFIALVIFAGFSCVHFEKTGTQSKVAPDFFTAKHSKIAIAVTPYPIVGSTYRETKGTLYSSFKITDAMDTALTSYVRTFDYTPFYSVKSRFVDILTKLGMQIELLDDKAIRINKETYEYLEKRNANWAAVRTLKEQVNADYIILFVVKAAGVMEDNLLPPFKHRKGLFSTNGYLLDLRSGAIKWKYNQGMQGVPVLGEWNQPPEYPNVTKTINEAMTKSVDDLCASFFSDVK